MELEKRELNSRFGVLYSTLKRFIRVLEDGQHGNTTKPHDTMNNSSSGARFLQPLSNTMGRKRVFLS